MGLSFRRIGSGCYFYGFFKLNWFRAMEFCHSFGQGTSLATVETEKENKFIKHWLLRYGDPNTGVWLGGSDNGHHGRWAWFPTGKLIHWWAWGPGQPNGPDQHCLYMVGGFMGYQWADFHCEFEMTFLCEYDANPGSPGTQKTMEEDTNMRDVLQKTMQEDNNMRDISEINAEPVNVQEHYNMRNISGNNTSR